MNPTNQLFTLAWTFGLMSLFAVGGALSAIPEMHRVAVDVHHWMSDRQFADMVAIAQLSPGPNVLVVTLIGFHVAGVAGGLIATLAMCGPTAAVAYFVSRTMDRSRDAQWPSLIQSALVPVSIGLMARERHDPRAFCRHVMGRSRAGCCNRAGNLVDAAASAFDAGRGRLSRFRWRHLEEVARNGRNRRKSGTFQGVEEGSLLHE